jgi:hypothetical protein
MTHPTVTGIINSLRGLTLTAEDADAIMDAVHICTLTTVRRDSWVVRFHSEDRVTLPDRTIEAQYYKHENGWVLFKDASHKAVCDIPENTIRMISRQSDVVKP